ncbi:MAG: 50S ribosomal protein L10 [Candidatus Falkowbacteria bacterium]
MAKTKQQKESIQKTLANKIKTAKSFVVSSYNALKVSELEDLRNKCREAKAEVIAAKKTLFKRALIEQGIEGIDSTSLEGSLAVIFGSDEIAPAKLAVNFAKGKEHVKFWQGVLENKVINQEMIKQLASLPGKQELLAQLVYTMNGPISGFANVLAGNLRGLVSALNAIKNNKQ